MTSVRFMESAYRILASLRTATTKLIVAISPRQLAPSQSYVIAVHARQII